MSKKNPYPRVFTYKTATDRKWMLKMKIPTD